MSCAARLTPEATTHRVCPSTGCRGAARSSAAERLLNSHLSPAVDVHLQTQT